MEDQESSTIVERELRVRRVHSWWETAEGSCPLSPPQDKQIGLCVCPCGWIMDSPKERREAQVFRGLEKS